MSLDRSSLERALFALGDHVRYVAFGVGQDIHTAQRGTPEGASDEGSDFYEELLVNPTLLTIARQRGDLDCGGLSHVIVGYGSPTHRRQTAARDIRPSSTPTDVPCAAFRAV